MEHKKKAYLTIHGHFYQPPRENPWLEEIELQDSALPFHDWNERISQECYDPNSVSRIVNNKNQIIDVVNNYEHMSFNFGPTLMSWLEENAPKTYERIIQADCQSVQSRSGHGNAIAQVYNHMIMPLANYQDKVTQTIWGIKDFQYRFGRKPEGIWLAETAVDDETLEVLVDNDIKYTILSPYQAQKVRPLQSDHWQDVGWGNIDPARAYRYYLKNYPEKYIDLFFYDGAISKSVAFDHLLKDGDRFIKRLQDGISQSRNYTQLVNIGTDGESYGHHTKFGDMALSYIQKIKAPNAGFTLTNYGEFLEKEPPVYEVDIKPVSSWSCFHGVGRWKEDCGCSTGAQPGWNQKWRKPLRDGLDCLRDELVKVFEESASKYFKNPWTARNKYIDVVLDRSDMSIANFLENEQKQPLGKEEQSDAIKLLEMQRQAMLMYTSCGWFFSEISGIETVQIMKYAARAIQLAEEFTEKDLETPFLEYLDKAKSNLKEHGTGKDIYEKFVRPSIVNLKQVVSHWAISSLFEEYSDETDIYCYTIKRKDYRKVTKGNTDLAIGKIQIKSKVTLEAHDMIFALVRFSTEDFHCTIKEYTGNAEYNKIKTSLLDKFSNSPLTEIIRNLDELFGKEYYTLKDLFFEERRKIISVLLQDKLAKFASTYQTLYHEGKGSILELHDLGLDVPPEFKMVAEYTLSKSFNNLFEYADRITDADVIQQAKDVNDEAKKVSATLDKKITKKIFSKKLTKQITNLSKTLELDSAQRVSDIIEIAKELEIKLDITEAQNVYFNLIHPQIPAMIESLKQSEDIFYDKDFVSTILKMGENLNICTNELKKELLKATTTDKVRKAKANIKE